MSCEECESAEATVWAYDLALCRLCAKMLAELDDEIPAPS